ncbi:MAG: hypothetical protein F4148_16310 [Caldilineaceae bacterium SB0675_bin_29]|uniref:DUF4435 domain-containing protein n=1 Tax=Caldilineaceae bacterium SB0675_bin_29 TaxID=2605266 RepID=A0A6B1GAX8_9CHLR|nr:hypothetical protein [Caldilineaceae bacterium SB0675_bin_29]
MTSKNFDRTTQGKIAQFRFFDEPVVWVEGETDYPIYEQLLGKMGCKTLWAGGKPECWKLVEAMIADDLPYVVVLDGDYEILRRRKSYHRRALLLGRYAIENYCAEIGLVQNVCRRYSYGKVVVGDVGSRFGRLLDRIEGELMDLVILDIALAQVGGKDGKGVLAGNVRRILEVGVPLMVDREKVKHLVAQKDRDGFEKEKDEARELLNRFVGRKRFVDILKGSWAFGLIYHFIASELQNVKITMRMDKRELRVALGAEMWVEDRSRDHRSLRRRLKTAVREVKRMRRLR